MRDERNWVSTSGWDKSNWADSRMRVVGTEQTVGTGIVGNTCAVMVEAGNRHSRRYGSGNRGREREITRFSRSRPDHIFNFYRAYLRVPFKFSKSHAYMHPHA